MKESLSVREREVLEYAQDGEHPTNRSIAEEMGISTDSVKRYKNRIRVKGWKIEVRKPVEGAPEPENSDADETYDSYLAKEERRLKAKQDYEEAIRNRFFKLISSVRPFVPAPFIGFESKPTRTEEDFVLLLADFHGGEEVSEDQCDSVYNMDIMKQRVRQLYPSVMSIVRAQSKSYNTLHVVALGDMVSGNIHDELKQSTTVTEQVIEVAGVISELLRNLSAHFTRIEFAGVVGNHGRLTKKPTAKNVHDNFDYLVYAMVKAMCSNMSNIVFDLNIKKNYYKTIQGKTFMFTHGDAIPGGGSWTSLEKATQKWNENYMKKEGKLLNYICMGHFHRQACMEKNFGEVIMCGSLKGGDEFAQNTLGYTSSPQQMMFSIHPRRGKTCSYNINF